MFAITPPLKTAEESAFGLSERSAGLNPGQYSLCTVSLRRYQHGWIEIVVRLRDWHRYFSRILLLLEIVVRVLE